MKISELLMMDLMGNNKIKCFLNDGTFLESGHNLKHLKLPRGLQLESFKFPET